MAVRTIVPMLKSCCQFSMATWKSWRRSVEVGDDRLQRPVAVAVDDVAPVALGEQLLVVHLAAGARGPRTLPRPDADLGRAVRHRVVRRARLVRDGMVGPGAGRGSRRENARPTATSGFCSWTSLAPTQVLHPLLLGIKWLDPSTSCRATARLHLDRAGHRVRRVRAVLPVPARRHAALRPRPVHRRRRRHRTPSSASATSRSSWCWPCCCSPWRPSRGNVVGYEIGRKIGPPLYERDGRILKKKYFDNTTAFFDRHGNKALVLGPVRAVRAHLHHRRRRRHPDGAAPLLRRGAPSARCCGSSPSP